MFGYFVRKVDMRFQLERSLGLLESDASDAVQRLERLFAQVQILLPDMIYVLSRPPVGHPHTCSLWGSGDLVNRISMLCTTMSADSGDRRGRGPRLGR